VPRSMREMGPKGQPFQPWPQAGLSVLSTAEELGAAAEGIKGKRDGTIRGTIGALQ